MARPELIDRITQLKRQGKTISETAHRLNAEGYFNTVGGSFNVASIHDRYHAVDRDTKKRKPGDFGFFRWLWSEVVN